MSMSMYDLSIVIPALNEEWLARTIEDIVEKKRGKTEVIAVLDGAWTDPAIADHPDVRIIYTSKNRGQRGATNLGVKLSTAKWVAKCDAHVAFDEGFDVKLLEAVKGHDDWTIVPVMRNMHIFNWRCMDCGDETYQGPVPEGCKNCNVNTPDRFEKVLVWRAKPSPNSSAFKFTPTKLQFKYFGSLKKQQQESGETVCETMSLQGSFFMLSRERYWSLNICDESWGGWGQQGTEVALKSWLSGGRVVCHMDTWYAHMFRTQNAFAFPWNGNGVSQGQQQHQARKISQDLFFNNKWEKQVRPLSWLVERFWEPLQQEPNTDDDPKWTRADLDRLKAADGKFAAQPELTKGILYFTDGELPEKIAKPCLDAIQTIAKDKAMPLEISLMEGDETRGYETMFRQILRGLQRLQTDVVFMAEHDVLYPPEHFDFTPPDKRFWYDQNWWKVHEDGLAVHWDADQVSGLVADRQELIKYYKYRIDTFDKENFDRKFEPFSGEGSASWKAPVPHIDIRHKRNLTYNKRELKHFRNKATAVNFETTTIDKIPDWDDLSSVIM